METQEHEGILRDFLTNVEPIRLREPFAQTLGVFQKDDALLEYTFLDVVKMAGHACPTTAGAYLCCQEALKRLYPGEIPIRGDISIKVYGEPDEGVYGVISQVFSLITGAAPGTGFRGLGHAFRRKDLLTFHSEKLNDDALCFEFSRAGSNKYVLVRFYPDRIPFPAEKARRMGALLEKVIWQAAKEDEKREFQDLWMGKVKSMLLERNEIHSWIRIEERRREDGCCQNH
jgi:hypothetical protein